MLLSACLDADTGVDDGLAVATQAAVSGHASSEGAGLLAALVALAVNVGDLEVLRIRLVDLVARMNPKDRARAKSRLTQGSRMHLSIRGDREAACAIFDEPSGDGAVTTSPTASGASVLPAASANNSTTVSGRGAAGGIRDLIQNAPKDFRCALDGKLVCDPVVSPAGQVFERSTLIRWLQKHGEVCPFTGGELSLAACERSPELRRRVNEWIRSQRGLLGRKGGRQP
eukprot:TRINITY_DN21023_c0_g1_i1.p1 TRINITY_DN21023_c0_g1~~TRINITY_DN21023_c0_g1_i1.p1  ORF type:complete len:228 (+),score=23.59 TRINITY_DN21023_c0_g1_i1:179-862(+)